MAITFPTTLDTLTNPSSTDTLDSPSHSSQHSDVNDAVEALEAKVGVDSSAVTSSLDYKVTNTSSSNPGHKHTLANGATDVTASVSELNTLDGITSSTAELNILDGVTADATEINTLDGITASTAELNKTDGVAGDIVGTTDTQTLTNKTLTSPSITLNTNALMGYNVNLADDNATSFTPSYDRLYVIVHSINGAGNYGTAEIWCVNGAVVGTRISGSSTFEVTTGALTGTTGTDAKFTISPHSDGKIYVENRLGATRTFSLTMIG